MYAYPQHHPHFYENQRHWKEPHHPLSPHPYEMYDENEYYYYPDVSNNKRHGHYDTSRRRKSSTLHDYSTQQHPLTSNRYADPYYPSPDYYYYEPAEDETDDIYYYPHYHQNPHHRHGARSASPSKRKDRKRQHSRLHHKSSFKKNEAWTQPTPFVNPQPMIMDPMMNLQQQHQQILGTCTTDAIMPIIPNSFGLMPQAPMINHAQPYFMPLPSASANYPPPFAFHHQQQQQQQQALLPFVQHMPPPPLLSDLFNTLSIQDNSKPTDKADQTETASANQEPSPAQQEQQQPKTAPPTPMTRPTQRPLQRRRSMMETVLSSFSLLGNNQSSTNLAHKSWDPSTYVSLNEALKLGTSNANDMDAKNESAISNSLSPRSVASASSAAAASTVQNEEGAGATLSRRDSLKLSQKMNALQSRHYIWCYKPQNEEAALWAAFDVKNQRKLDHHYAKLTSKKQQMIQQQQQQQKESDKDPATAAAAADTAATSFLPDDVITLSKQSQLHGPVIVSLNKAIAWCFDNDSSFSFGSSEQKHILLDIACLPSQQNRFVVSNQLVSKDPVVRRSKSVDGGLANKFINSVLKW